MYKITIRTLDLFKGDYEIIITHYTLKNQLRAFIDKKQAEETGIIIPTNNEIERTIIVDKLREWFFTLKISYWLLSFFMTYHAYLLS